LVREQLVGGALVFDRATSTEVDNLSEKTLKLNKVNANDSQFALAA
jgi:hypothetical protein